jgi:hypothetical protein
MLSRFLDVVQALIVIVGVALLAASLARVDGSDTAIQLRCGFVGAGLGAAAVFLVWALRPSKVGGGNLFADSLRYRGLKIMTYGMFVALIGWLAGVFISLSVGYWIAVLGIVVGFVGLIIHFATMLRATK